MMPTMASEVVVDPACAATDRRPPEGLTENPTNHPTGNCADGTGNYKPRPSSCGRTDHVSPCSGRDRRHQHCGCYRECNQTHGFPPFVDEGYPPIPGPIRRLEPRPHGGNGNSVRHEGANIRAVLLCGHARQPSCAPKTGRGGLRPTSRSCRSLYVERNPSLTDRLALEKAQGSI